MFRVGLEPALPSGPTFHTVGHTAGGRARGGRSGMRQAAGHAAGVLRKAQAGERLLSGPMTVSQ